MSCEYCPENMMEKLGSYRPYPVDDWDDYVRVVKLALDYCSYSTSKARFRQ